MIMLNPMLKTYFIVFNATHTQITLFLWSASSFDMFGTWQDQCQELIIYMMLVQVWFTYPQLYLSWRRPSDRKSGGMWFES